MDTGIKTLYVGAHPDDVSIGASIAISRDPSHSYVFTVTNGGVGGQTWPRTIYGVEFNDSFVYGQERLKEERRAMGLLNLDPYHYFNAKFPDKQTHLDIPEIVHCISNLVESWRIERIVTHALPEAHPDHEAVSLSSHFVGNRNSLPVYEYPLYVKNAEGEEITQQFLYNEPSELVTTLHYTPHEKDLREKVLQAYPTQEFIRRMFSGRDFESFRLVARDFEHIPEGTGYYYGNDDALPTPSDIRKQFFDFKENNS